MHDVTLDTRLWLAQEAADEARVERWLASEGDAVHAGDAIARVRLLHQTIDVTAPHSGVLEQILVAAGDRFGRGDVLARVVPW